MFDVLAQLLRKSAIRISSLAEGTWVDRITEMEFDWMQSEAAASRPGLKRSPDTDRDDRHSQLVCENRSAFLESSNMPIDRPRAFRKNQKRPAILQAGRADLHRSNQVHIRINR